MLFLVDRAFAAGRPAPQWLRATHLRGRFQHCGVPILRHPRPRVKIGLFILSGVVAALAGMLFAGYVSSARANNGTGLELSVIAIVLIGGVNMFGGKGSFVGVVLSLVLVTTLTSWMNLGLRPHQRAEHRHGALMIAAVVHPGVAKTASATQATSSTQHRPPRSPALAPRSGHGPERRAGTPCTTTTHP